jgi:hypothetical protein
VRNNIVCLASEHLDRFLGVALLAI